MKGMPGILLLLMIAASVEADTSANETTTAMQDNGMEGDLAPSVSQSKPNTLACGPFCFPELGGRKREMDAEALAAERMRDTKVQRRFQPESPWSAVERSDFTSFTIPRLIETKRKALKREQQMQAKQIRKDRQSIASFKRGVSEQFLRQ